MSADQLLDILKEAQVIAEQDAQLRLQACPNDGTPLRTGPDGQPYCPFDGRRPDC